MATLTLTPDAESAPPSILVEVEGGAGEVVSSVSLTRDGAPVLGSAMAGFTTATYTDYSAPYGVPCTYRAIGTSTVQTWPALWSEAWVSLASWTGSGWSVASGVASSQIYGASISRSAASFGKITVTDPSYVRLELLSSGGSVVGSVACTTSTVVAGTTSTTIPAAGSFSAWLIGTTMHVSVGSLAASVVVPSAVASVRIVSLATAVDEGAYATRVGIGGDIMAMDRDSSGNLYIAAYSSKEVWKYSPSGTLLTYWSTTGNPWDIAVDSSDNVYVTDRFNKLVRKYSSTGTSITTWSTTGTPRGITVDASDNVWVCDYSGSHVRKYSASGSTITDWAVATAYPTRIAISGSGDVYLTFIDSGVVNKYSSTGSLLSSWSSNWPEGISIDPAGNVYVTEEPANLIHKYTAAGAALVSWSAIGGSRAVTSDSTYVWVGDMDNKRVRKYFFAAASAGQIEAFATCTSTSATFGVSGSATLSPDGGWLIHPKTPALSIPLARDGQTEAALNLGKDAIGETSRESQAGRQRAAGSTDDAVFTVGERSAPSLSVTGFTLTDAVWSQIVNLLKDESPIILRFPPSWLIPMEERWYAVGDYTEQFVSPDSRLRMVTLPLSPAATPYVIVQPVWNEAALVLRYATEADVVAAYATEYDKLIDNPRP